MKLYINGRFLTQSVTGVQRYAIEVIKALDNLIESGFLNKLRNNIIILTPKNITNNIKFKNIEIKKIGKLKGHLWEQVDLAQYTSGQMLLNLCNSGPLIKKNQMTVIHDVAVYANGKNFSVLFRNWYKLLLKTQAVNSIKIITVSNFSKEEILKYLKIRSNKIKVIYEGKEHFTEQKENQSYIYEKDLNTKPYILAVSSLNPNKNFGAIVKAMDYLKSTDFNIVIAGGTDPKVFSQTDEDLPSNVIHLGYVSDSELKTLYKNAFCFVYPSFYEGFGLPPLEAMSIGCPVIISNRASLPEVGGDAALYCDPQKPEDIARQIKKMISDNNLRNELIHKGLIQSEKFTWEKCAYEIFQPILK